MSEADLRVMLAELAGLVVSVADGLDARWERDHAEDASRLRSPAEELLVNHLRRKAAAALAMGAAAEKMQEVMGG